MYSKYGKEVWEKRTIIKDMVHGYIEIPKPIMREIIDTEQFQRLKDIEQTGMEALYPSATHKRFTHSLGVYYLSRKAFAEFKNNIAVSYPDIYLTVATTAGIFQKDFIFHIITIYLKCYIFIFTNIYKLIFNRIISKAYDHAFAYFTI